MATNTNKPWSLQSSELETWYNENIQSGTSDFKDEFQLAIDKVVKYIHRVCSKRSTYYPELFDVSKVVKGGSFGKGTMVQTFSDVDMVVFINPPYLEPIHCYSSPKKYREALKEVIESLRSAISQMSSVRNIKSDEYLVGFEVNVGVGDEWVPFDLLPTANNFGSGTSTGMTEIFEKMLEMEEERGSHSASLVEYQRDFVRDQPGYVKELIRLVKYWAYKQLPKKLQKSYPLELITIYCWEEAGFPDKFSKAQGLKAVLTTLAKLETLHHYWKKHYSPNLAEKCIRKFKIESPYVLDPVNPTNNACYVYWEDRKTEMEKAAKSTLQCRLLCDVTDWD